VATLHSKAGALVAAAVTIVDVFTWNGGVWVQNRDATAEMWVRLDGTDPTVAGDDCFLVQPGGRNFPTGNGVVRVRMISSGTPSYAVSGSVPAVFVVPT
jgi:hypothetical protein